MPDPPAVTLKLPHLGILTEISFSILYLLTPTPSLLKAPQEEPDLICIGDDGGSEECFPDVQLITWTLWLRHQDEFPDSESCKRQIERANLPEDGGASSLSRSLALFLSVSSLSPFFGGSLSIRGTANAFRYGPLVITSRGRKEA